MTVQRLPSYLIAVLILLLCAKVASIWPHLPARVAVHFDAAGIPNGWMSRSGMLISCISLMALFAACSVAAGFVRRLPDRLINLPRKNYWLAPERRAETLDWIVGGMRWFLVATLTFMVWVLGAALDANLAVPPRLTLPAWHISAFATVAVAMIAVVFVRFVRSR